MAPTTAPSVRAPIVFTDLPELQRREARTPVRVIQLDPRTDHTPDLHTPTFPSDSSMTEVPSSLTNHGAVVGGAVSGAVAIVLFLIWIKIVAIPWNRRRKDRKTLTKKKRAEKVQWNAFVRRSYQHPRLSPIVEVHSTSDLEMALQEVDGSCMRRGSDSRLRNDPLPPGAAPTTTQVVLTSTASQELAEMPRAWPLIRECMPVPRCATSPETLDRPLLPAQNPKEFRDIDRVLPVQVPQTPRPLRGLSRHGEHRGESHDRDTMGTIVTHISMGASVDEAFPMAMQAALPTEINTIATNLTIDRADIPLPGSPLEAHADEDIFVVGDADRDFEEIELN